MPLKGSVSVQGACVWLVPLARRHMACVLKAMLDFSPCPWLHVDVRLVRDGCMAGINQQYMQCSGPTNILSFPSSQNPQQDAPTNDAFATLVLAVDTVQREAVLYGQEPHSYTVWLLAHGMGHLMGYDHGRAMDELCGDLFSVGMESLEAAMQHSASFAA